MNHKGKMPVGRPPTIDAARSTILIHAARLFAENGFEQTSLQDVGRSVGVSKAAVYHYFRSKQEIYDEIAVGLLDGLFSRVKAAVSETVEGEDRLAVFMKAHAGYFEQNFEGFATLLLGVGGLRAQLQSKRQIEVRDQYESFLRKLLAEEVSAGRMIIGDVALAARAILSVLNWMSRWYKPGGPYDAIEIAEQYFTILSDGLKAGNRPS